VGSTRVYGVLVAFQSNSGFVAQLILCASAIYYRRSLNEDGGTSGFENWSKVL